MLLICTSLIHLHLLLTFLLGPGRRHALAPGHPSQGLRILAILLVGADAVAVRDLPVSAAKMLQLVPDLQDLC